MQDFEKLGVFYLGRMFDIEKGQALDNLLLYDSKDLTTHAVCVGMTGSGKTGFSATFFIGFVSMLLSMPSFALLKRILWRSSSRRSLRPQVLFLFICIFLY